MEKTRDITLILLHKSHVKSYKFMLEEQADIYGFILYDMGVRFK
jgi:hypothetical protein